MTPDQRPQWNRRVVPPVHTAAVRIRCVSVVCAPARRAHNASWSVAERDGGLGDVQPVESGHAVGAGRRGGFSAGRRRGDRIAREYAAGDPRAGRPVHQIESEGELARRRGEIGGEPGVLSGTGDDGLWTRGGSDVPGYRSGGKGRARAVRRGAESHGRGDPGGPKAGAVELELEREVAGEVDGAAGLRPRGGSGGTHGRFGDDEQRGGDEYDGRQNAFAVRIRDGFMVLLLCLDSSIRHSFARPPTQISGVTMWSSATYQ